MKKIFFAKILLTGLITGLCNGLFGAGGGMIAVPAMVKFLGLDEHDAHATAIAVILPLAVISSVIYHKNGYLDLSKAWKVAAGGVLGGLIGAYLLHHIPSGWLQRIFALFMIIAAVRLIF